MLSCAPHSMSMAVIGILALLPAAAQAGQIWLGGMDTVTAADREGVGQEPRGTYARLDFMDLLRPNAPWTRTASMMQVFQSSTQFLHRSTDDQLSTVINDLHRRHIALGMRGEIMSRESQAQCGAGVPGNTGINVWRTIVNRVARLGGKIGHYNINKQATACNYTIDELVRT
jgi:hypothetical protein